ncbi:glutaredoxin family protein [Alloscardovia criceti]|uniref:glutaredoxin family protein n=1 Tax=Alloscardovia criceti TaxID=356828 RepID=UPI00039CD380|nr:glutaredoxin [Alloscardovia criceti]
MAHSLELFYKEDCPYCHKVMDFMEENGIRIEMNDVIANPHARERLISVGGKPQVPCLFIDGKPLYESLDIIDFLAKEFNVHRNETLASVNARTDNAIKVESSGACDIDGTCH